MLTKKQKKAIKKSYVKIYERLHHNTNDKLSKPLTVLPRTLYYDFDYLTEIYIETRLDIIKEYDKMTTCEIEQLIDCEEGIHYGFSPYDCTGKIFTCGIDVKKYPIGYVIKHRKALDV